MDDNELGVLLQKELASAIEGVISQHESGFVTKWIALVETVGPDGTRGLWPMTSDDLKAWDTKGLLSHAMDLQAAATIADQLSDGDDA